MYDEAFKSAAKEDLVILGIVNPRNIVGFRTIFGNKKDELSISEIVDRMDDTQLKSLRGLIDRSLPADLKKSAQ